MHAIALSAQFFPWLVTAAVLFTIWRVVARAYR